MRARNLLATLLTVWACAIGAGNALAQNDRNPMENSPADRSLQGARLDDIHLWMADSYATLTQLVVVTPDCAFRGGTSVNFRRNVNKVGITQDIPADRPVLCRHTPARPAQFRQPARPRLYRWRHAVCRSAPGRQRHQCYRRQRPFASRHAHGKPGERAIGTLLVRRQRTRLHGLQRRQSRLPIPGAGREFHRHCAGRCRLRGGRDDATAAAGPAIRNACWHRA